MLTSQHFDTKPVVKNRLNVLPNNPEAADETKAVGPGRFPSWLHRKLPQGAGLWKTDKILGDNHLHTVCEECKCPNQLECWSKKTATYLAMGKDCTRSCGFCNINFSKTPAPLADDEPERIASSALLLGLQHVVITMVTRDDLPDGGAEHLVKIIQTVRVRCPGTTLEVLTSDFSGSRAAWDAVIAARPEIYNYNVETVRSLTSTVRHRATYDRTLELLAYIKEKGDGILVKSGIMVGLGETVDQVKETIDDLKKAGCDIITIGQYLQASPKKLRVKAFVTPEQFKEYEEYGYAAGLKQMYCGPFVRSSYNAAQVLEQIKKDGS